MKQTMFWGLTGLASSERPNFLDKAFSAFAVQNTEPEQDQEEDGRLDILKTEGDAKGSRLLNDLTADPIPLTSGADVPRQLGHCQSKQNSVQTDFEQSQPPNQETVALIAAPGDDVGSKSSEPDAEWQFEGNGLIHAYLAGAKNEAFPTVKTLQTGTKPKYNTMDDVLEKFGDKYKYLTVNKGKKCPRCAKPCAYTLGNCNDCSQDLRNVEVSTTENVFMAFVFGVKKGPFPYTISLRSESKRYMVIDDLLATAPMHLLVIPTFSWIPDFRHLFLAPERALVIIDEMEREGRKVMREQFWENPDFKNKYWSTIEDMESLILPGLNFPPSQWHLHLQFLAPPTTPFYHNELQKGNFFHYRRFFHLKYVKEALKSALSQPLTKDISESPIEEVIQIFDERNISYDNIYNAEIKRWETMQKKCSAYHGEDFTRVVIEDTVVDMNLQKTGEDPKELQKRDKKMIQNYGRPYNGSLVSGTYYSFAKDPTDLEKWPPQTQA